MTASIKATADGLSAIIQVGGADKLTINSDGSLVATADPATGVRSKALATMQKFADEFGSSLAASGYQKLPSGLIIQWGSATGASGTVTYPVAFSTVALPVLSSNGNGYSYFGTKTLTNFAFNTTSGINWLAVGY